MPAEGENFVTFDVHTRQRSSSGQFQHPAMKPGVRSRASAAETADPVAKRATQTATKAATKTATKTATKAPTKTVTKRPAKKVT